MVGHWGLSRCPTQRTKFMSRIIDKVIIFILSIFAMCFLMHGNSFLVSIYAAIVILALNYYLLGRERLDWSMRPEGAKEWIAFVIEIAAMALPFFIPEAVVLIPIVAYDVTMSRNYIGAGVGVISFATAWKTIDEIARMPIIMSSKWDSYDASGIGISTETMYRYRHFIFLYILALTVLSVILSIKSERMIVARREQRKLRDDSQEKSEKLREQNREILLARDSEVYNAQLSERNRIAREIHDNVGHMLSRALLQMGALLAIHKEEPIHSELTAVRETLDTAMNNIRSSVHDLHDESIDVAASIEDMAEPLKEKFILNLDIDISDDMQRPVKYAIIGIAKECISNIIKHSNNANVDIRLQEHPSMYQLVVHDYGKRTDSPDSRAGYGGAGRISDGGSGAGTDISSYDNAVGMGLENIRNRAQSVGGTCNISNDNGFRVFVTVPRG